MKKTAFLLAGCLTFTAFASAIAPTMTAHADEEVYNVTVQWPAFGEPPAGLAAVEEAINAITIPEIGCSLELVPVNPFNIANETALAVSSGEKLDICLSLFSGVSGLVNSGTVIPLDELVDEYGADIREACGDIRMKAGMYDDAMYAVPIAYINGEIYGYAARTDLLEKYGIEIEDRVYSMEELGEIFATVKAGEGDNFYCIAGTNSNTELFQCLYPFDILGTSTASGVLMLCDDPDTLTVTNLFETEAYAKYAETMYEWAQNGYFPADAATLTENAGDMVKGGNYLGWFPGTVTDGAGYLSSRCGMDITVIQTTEPWMMGRFMQNVLWSITSTSEKPEKAMQLLNYIYKNDDVANMLQYGLEGSDYVVVESTDEGTVIDYPDGLDMSSVPYFQVYGIFGNRFNWYIQAPNPVDQYVKARAFNDSIENCSKAVGYTFVTDSVSSQYSAVSSVISQYQAIISTGSVDPAQELPEFIDALKAAGIDEVIAENQRQLDEWAAKQE